MSDEQRELWDITPHKVVLELSEGNIRMREDAVYNGRLRVAKALDHDTTEDFVWLYAQAQSRDGADIILTESQTRDLRDALNECLEDGND